MAGRARKPFLMRASSGVMLAVERLASAELRSVNAQLEVLLREALERRGIATTERGTSDDSA
jgi:hypothetical protein